jgi:hypothetical protein
MQLDERAEQACNLAATAAALAARIARAGAHVEPAFVLAAAEELADAARLLRDEVVFEKAAKWAGEQAA